MADGSIKIKTRIDNTESQKDLNELEKMCDRTAKNVEKTKAKVTVSTETDDGVSSKKKSKWLSVTNDSSLKKAQARLKAIREEIKKIEAETNKDLKFAVTDDQTANLLELESRLTKELNAEYDHLIQQVGKYEQAKQKAVNEKLGEKQAKETFKGASAELSTEASSTAFLSKIQTQEQYNAALTTTKARMTEIEASARRIATEKGVDVNSLLMANGEYKKLENRLKILTAHQKSFKASTTSAFSSASKMADKFGAAIKRGIKNMARYTLAMFGVRGAMTAIRQVANSYIADNEALSNSIEGIKGAFGEMLGPTIERVVNLIKIAMSYVFAFIKALTGVDYVARYNAKALDKQTTATKELAKAQRQSAGFDEQNKLSDPSSSSSGSVGSVGTLELPTISDDALQKIQKFVEMLQIAKSWIEDNKEELLAMAGAVALAFAIGGIVNWAKQFPNIFALLSTLKTKLATFTGFALLAAGIFLVVDGIKDMIENGPNWQNILTILAGAIMVVVGAILIFNASLLASPVTWIVIGIMALIAAIALCVVYWDEIKAAFQRFWDKVKEGLEKIKEKFAEAWDKIKEKWNGVKQFFSNIWQGIKDTFANVKTWFKDKFTQAWESIKNVFSKVGSFFGNIWTTIKEKFTSIGSSIGNAIGDAFKTVVNSILNFAENTINKFIKAINGAIGLINKIPGVNIPTLNTLTIPKLAKGGIVNNIGKGVPLIAGEAGKEAILPLENNTEWMDVLVDKINGGNTTIPIYLDGKMIAKYIIDLQKRKAFATNGG